MKKTTLILLVLLGCLKITAQQNLLSGKYTAAKLKEILIPLPKWTPFPRLNDREGWSKANQPMMQAIVKEAEGYINYKWPSIPATLSLLIERTGNRSEYESVSFEKRSVLGTLLLAEVYRTRAGLLTLLLMAYGTFAKNHGGVRPPICRITKSIRG